MDELQQFIYYDNVAMAVKQDDDFWFVVKDVCKVLEIRLSHRAVANCPEGDVHKRRFLHQAETGISYCK